MCMIFLLLLKSLTLYLINYIAYQLIQLINQVKQSYDYYSLSNELSFYIFVFMDAP